LLLFYHYTVTSYYTAMSSLVVIAVTFQCSLPQYQKYNDALINVLTHALN